MYSFARTKEYQKSARYFRSAGGTNQGLLAPGNPKAVGLHTKNPSRFAKGFFVFRRLEAPQSLRDSSLKEGASGKTGKRYGLPGNFAVMPRTLPLGELSSPIGLD